MDKNELIERVENTLADLKRERDEMRVKAHLAKMEASDEWKEIEAKFVRMESHVRELAEQARHSLKDATVRAATALGEDIRDGLKRFSKGL
jgi:hypothetical protein